jgi:hypothetical protein
MPYPKYQDQISNLVVSEHAKLENEPLRLAIYYASGLAPNDDCVFEVISNFGYDEVSEDRKLFQVQYGPTNNFPMEPKHRLRLILTNPIECRTAINEDWEEIRDLRQAIAGGQYEVIYKYGDSVDQQILGDLRQQRVAA